MIRRLRLTFLGGLAAVCVLIPTRPTAAAAEESRWQAVEQAVSEGLPRTALEKLEPILLETRAQKAWGEFSRAFVKKIELEGEIEGKRPEEKIRRLDEAMASAPVEVLPLLESVQAYWFWSYFQQNKWRFMRRSAISSPSGDDLDFTTWDLRRVFQEIDHRFEQALAGAAALQAVPVSQFDGLLVAGGMPDRYRPTLYDFIAHKALEFYTSGEQAGARPEDDFVVAAEDPVFDSIDAFLAWEPEGGTAPTPSPLIRAIRLYQSLLRFHQNDRDTTALADVDLARLLFGQHHATGPQREARFEAALEAFVERYADDEVASMAFYHWARFWENRKERVRAHELAVRGIQIHSTSPGADQCRNLIARIKAPTLQLRSERVWNQPWPPVQVRYRNLTNLHLRIIAWDWNDFLNRNRSRPEEMRTKAERKELLDREPVLAWSSELPATLDYQERTEALKPPREMKPGFYFLIASADRGFGEQDNQVVFTDIWVSDLALIVRPHQTQLEGFVLHAVSGEPIVGAEVMAWHLDSNGNRVPNSIAVRTDENGFFLVPGRRNSGSLVRARYRFDGVLHELGSMQQYRVRSVRTPEARPRTMLFTDRALYRPGQVILYKGICLLADPQKNDYRVLPGQRLTVALQDPNGRELAKFDHVCSTNGSFFGQFMAPQSAVTGRCRLRVVQGPSGAVYPQVEEYKRPKFQVTLKPPEKAARLGSPVSLSGKAESYTGAAVDGGTVKYRVVRQVRWPDWWGWFRGPSWRGRPSQEIAHGETTTAADGTFEISFTALADPAVLVSDEPTFEFRVHAEVVDSTGETRTAERYVRLGYAALRASMSAEDWQTTDRPIEITVRTESLDGDPRVSEGVLRVHRLQAPEQVHRPLLYSHQSRWRSPINPDEKGEADLSDPNQWALGSQLIELGYATDSNGVAQVRVALDEGVFRAVLDTTDAFGKKVTARLPLQVLKPESNRLAIRVPHLLEAEKWSVEPGGDLVALWGTGYEQGRAFVEIEHRGQMIRRFWTEPDRTQARIVQPVTEEMRGGFTLHITRVQENRAFLEQRRVHVPWSNKQFEIRWEHLTSKLKPNERETWTAVIKRRAGTAVDAEPHPAIAEMVATLYDASLDAYRPHRWSRAIGGFYHNNSRRHATFENVARILKHLRGTWDRASTYSTLRYRDFPSFLRVFRPEATPLMSRSFRNSASMPSPSRSETATRMAAMSPQAATANAEIAIAPDSLSLGQGLGAGDSKGVSEAESAPDLSQVTARKNLQETVAFFPQLTSDSNGVVRITFTMPEALTTWRFIGFAHDRELRSGYLEGLTKTSKDLMVQPNPPRFLREGDLLEFTVKVSNQSDATQKGHVRLTLSDAVSGRSADSLVGNSSPDQDFRIPPLESRSFSWKLSVPDGTGFLTYKAVGSTGKLSDGEEGHLPVLSRRILVTESLPLPIRGPGSAEFRFEKLLAAGDSNTLRHQGVTVQMVSNPAWYAVMALPYLMEFPHECSEQVFNRYYANTLARFIATSDPKIRRVFNQWRDTPALDSPLEKNEALKALQIEETPWLRHARNESQARRDVGVLFEDRRLSGEIAVTLRKLQDMQLNDGAWPWFPGGRGSDYITLYVATGFGRLRHLQADVDVRPALRAWERLDNWIQERHEQILKRPNPEEHVPSPIEALYLYGRSFFLKDRPVAGAHQPAVDFFLQQAHQHWLATRSRQTQGHLALALHRWGSPDHQQVAAAILRSLKEYSVTDDEMGRFWRDTEFSWWWYRAPIETQALMVEAFDEILDDQITVEELKVWMLKQKQTQDWKTTKATADAIYALLLRGADLLASTNLVEVTIGGRNITPGTTARTPNAELRASKAEAGTGFYERRFSPEEVVPALGEVSVTKVDAGVAWGGVHWQYLEDIAKITPHTATPLTLRKEVYVRGPSKAGPVLKRVEGPLAVGAELVTRVELRVDRDMEFVHLKDQRGSGTEPVNVLSGYRVQDGLAYYESTRDTATHFFIDYLPKGTYVLEYSSRVQHRGQYQSGIATIQCMYAPEFNSHSGSTRLRVE